MVPILKSKSKLLYERFDPNTEFMSASTIRIIFFFQAIITFLKTIVTEKLKLKVNQKAMILENTISSNK